MEQTTMTENGASKQIADLQMHEVEQGSSSSTENQEAYKENMDVLDKLLAEGHKLMLAQSFCDASVVLCKAAELSSKFFGDFAPQSFLPHFNYGKALIEVARLESLPIKPPVEDIDESDEEDEEEEQSEELKSKSGTEKEVVEDQQQQKKTEEQKEKTEEKGGEKGTDECAEERDGGEKQDEVEKADNEMAEVTLKTDNEEEADEDGGDEDDGQIAWESLEVARKICENQMKDDQAKLWTERKSDVLVALGDCMTVTENFPLALEEFTSALVIRKELFGEADRRTAEVYFWIGRTHKLMDDFKTAAEHFENAKKVLEAVIAAKERELKERGEENCDSLSQELEELKDTVKGVEEKVQDAVDSIVQQRKRDEAMKAMLQPLLMQVISANANTPLEVNDVTGMLKRKAVKRTLAMSDAIAEDKTEADVEQNAKMPRNETDGGKGEERPAKDCESNGN
ncbi:hypothetical protein niasHT_016742 [Heterodera trifolii]|uniref:Tetratricopeptide SHNi-TPR domain-containing protein n=1 Tax=Heterodera trifolii TaxID=157864 RepID=A0ABD2L7A0_9BILA